jgi:hypothetical protein
MSDMVSKELSASAKSLSESRECFNFRHGCACQCLAITLKTKIDLYKTKQLRGSLPLTFVPSTRTHCEHPKRELILIEANHHYNVLFNTSPPPSYFTDVCLNNLF